jgi:hypothetical protein
LCQVAGPFVLMVADGLRHPDVPTPGPVRIGRLRPSQDATDLTIRHPFPVGVRWVFTLASLPLVAEALVFVVADRMQPQPPGTASLAALPAQAVLGMDVRLHDFSRPPEDVAGDACCLAARRPLSDQVSERP